MELSKEIEHDKRRRYTWERPGDSGRFQLDYMLVRQRYRNSVKNARSYPGAEADTDRNLVVMNKLITLKKTGRKMKIVKCDLKNIDENAEYFQNKVMEKIKQSKREGDNIEIIGKL